MTLAWESFYLFHPLSKYASTFTADRKNVSILLDLSDASPVSESSNNLISYIPFLLIEPPFLPLLAAVLFADSVLTHLFSLNDVEWISRLQGR